MQIRRENMRHEEREEYPTTQAESHRVSNRLFPSSFIRTNYSNFQSQRPFDTHTYTGVHTGEIIHKFKSLMEDVKLEKCNNCLRRWIGLNCQFKQMGAERVLMCSKCRKNHLTFSLANNTIPESDEEVPICLRNLTFLEEMLIARVSLLIIITRLRGGQFSYSANCIAFPQDVQTLCDTLPRHPKDLDIIVVRKPGTQNNNRDFIVRKAHVLAALYWLKQHNDYYTNIQIVEDIDLPIHGVPELVTVDDNVVHGRDNVDTEEVQGELEETNII
eukprot:GHVR01151777.1.p1 GENE.GHVR01151777.1~~GHVR01151777.1.p1  ORF type:complete len:273 (-),score=19.31 GHVR01151777.1:1189-2007(-)